MMPHCAEPSPLLFNDRGTFPEYFGSIDRPNLRGEAPVTFGGATRSLAFSKGQTIYTQGDTADALFYIKEGTVKLTVVSGTGKEAILGILRKGEFFGEGGQPSGHYVWGLPSRRRAANFCGLTTYRRCLRFNGSTGSQTCL